MTCISLRLPYWAVRWLRKWLQVCMVFWLYRKSIDELTMKLFRILLSSVPVPVMVLGHVCCVWHRKTIQWHHDFVVVVQLRKCPVRNLY